MKRRPSPSSVAAQAETGKTVPLCLCLDPVGSLGLDGSPSEEGEPRKWRVVEQKSPTKSRQKLEKYDGAS
jgi:hypothetical protein